MNKIIKFLICLLISFIIVFLEFFNYEKYFSFILATVVQFLIGKEFYKKAHGALRLKIFDFNVLVSLSALSAYFYSFVFTFFLEGKTFYEASSLLLTIIYLGHGIILEGITRKKASEILEKFYNVLPKKVLVYKNGKEIEIELSKVKKNDIVIVKPENIIPVDGVIVEGSSSIDESSLTGEPLPIDKKVNDKVFAGTMNKFGLIKVRVEKLLNETVLLKIAENVEEALSTKTEMQKLVDKVSNIFVPFVILLSIIAFFVWIFILKNIYVALSIAITILVIACPCGLGLATPLALLSSISVAYSKKILVRNPQKLEQIKDINTIVLDKTGTLTEGKPFVYYFTNKKTIEIASIAEKNSEHPIAKAILDKVRKVKSAEKLKVLPGFGVIAFYKGKEIIVGNEKLIEMKKINFKKFSKEIERLKNLGLTIVYVCFDKKPLGTIGISDKIKKDSKSFIDFLKKRGYEVYMITGDNENSARKVANELKIEKFFANVLPNEKALIIKRLQEEGKKVMMVGDGINDSLALIQADVGIAVSNATDIAKSSGDIVLLRNDLKLIKDVIEISKRTYKRIVQNLFWAFLYNLIALPIAAGILYPFLITPSIGAIIMILSSLSVVFNSIRK